MREFKQTQNHDVSADAALARPPQEFMGTARTLVSLFERGLDERAEIFGWHGTSLEAIERTLILGSFPGSPVNHAGAAPGHLFFFPAREGDFDSGPATAFRNFGRPGAVRYAETSAQVAYMLREFGLDFGQRENHQLMFAALDHLSGYNPEGEAVLRRLEERGVSRERMQAEAVHAYERKGVLLALSRDAVMQFDASDGDEPGWDMKLHVPSGLPLSFIAGIEPLGEREFSYFESLQQLVSPRTTAA